MEEQRKLPQRNAASPLQILGFDGAPPQVAGVSDLQRPGVVNIQDTTQASYQAMENAILQSRQAVDSVSRSTAETTSTAIQAAAKVPRVGELIEPLMAGIELYNQSKAQEREQAAAALETRNQELAAQLESRVRDIAVQLSLDVEAQTTEEGYFTARTEAIQRAQQIAQQFREQGLPDSAITPVLAIIQEAASQGLRSDLTQYRELAEKERNTAADQAFSHLRLQLGPLIGSMAYARNNEQLDGYITEIYSQVDDFFAQNNIEDPQLRLQIQSMLVEQAAEKAIEAGNNSGLLQRRAAMLQEVTGAVNAATEEFNETGNYDLYQTTLRRLDAQYAPELGAGTVVSLGSDPMSGLTYQRELHELAAAEREYQDEHFRTMLEADPAARNARQQLEVGLAVEAFNNTGSGRDILSDTEHELHAGVKAQYELFTQDHETWQELHQQKLEYEETVQRGVVRVNELLDSLEPTERLGLPTTITQAGILSYQPELQQVLATVAERGQISQETYREYQRLFTIQNEIAAGTIDTQLRTLQQRWEPWGADITNPQNVSALQQRVGGAYDSLNTIRGQMQQSQAGPRPPGFQ